MFIDVKSEYPVVLDELLSIPLKLTFVILICDSVDPVDLHMLLFLLKLRVIDFVKAPAEAEMLIRYTPLGILLMLPIVTIILESLLILFLSNEIDEFSGVSEAEKVTTLLNPLDVT